MDLIFKIQNDLFFYHNPKINSIVAIMQCDCGNQLENISAIADFEHFLSNIKSDFYLRNLDGVVQRSEDWHEYKYKVRTAFDLIFDCSKCESKQTFPVDQDYAIKLYEKIKELK